MTIGFEAKRFFTNFTGLGNYSRFVVEALSCFHPENEYILYSPRKIDHPEINSIIANPNIEVVIPSGLISTLGLSSLWRTWGVSGSVSISKLNIFHGLSHEIPIGLPIHLKKVVTIHDLIYIRYPQFYKPIDVRIYKAKVTSACDRADKIIAISEQTAEDIREFLKIDKSKIEVIYQGCNANFLRNIDTDEQQFVKNKYSLPNEYILNVGSVEARKNVIVIVKALAALPIEDRLPLIIVGKKTAYLQNVIDCAKQFKVLPLIRFIHNASFKDFPAIYQGAKAFVYPSLFEGFGIPLIEAIESRVPVLTSKGSCFFEAAGPDAIYCNPTDHEEFADQLKKILNDRQHADRMVSLGLAYVQRFKPRRIAEDFNLVYRSL
jgi:glycosyltransferase involved in cell wall biosynthesis